MSCQARARESVGSCTTRLDTMMRLLMAAAALSACVVSAEEVFKALTSASSASKACGIDDCEGVRRRLRSHS